MIKIRKTYLLGLLAFVFIFFIAFSGQAILAVEFTELENDFRRLDKITEENASMLLHDWLNGQVDPELINSVSVENPPVEIVGFYDAVFPAETREYYVKTGDSLYKLAQRFNTTVAEIKEASSLYSDYLYIGQKLYIPVRDDVKDDQMIYYVKPGDSLYGLARDYETTVNHIKKTNNLSGDYLVVGQELILPKKQAGEHFIYRVKAGDSLYNIARNFNTTITVIKNTNNLEDNYLNIGQKLRIPINGDDNRNKKRISITEGEMELLARAVYSEARGEPYKGQVAIAAVIINRVLHPVFPNTIEHVIFQPWQFTAVHDGQFWLQPNREAYRASDDALNGWDPSNGAIYYYNPQTATSRWVFYRKVVVKIGNHYFAV